MALSQGNTTLNASIIAAEALRILENECVMGRLCYRGYEEEFDKKVNGYTVGTSISVRRPTDFTVRDGRTASMQTVVEGSFNLAVDKQKGIDFQFSSYDLTLNIEELSQRVIRPGMIQLANQIDRDMASLYANVYNWVGTPGTNVGTFAGFSKAPERLDLLGVPQDSRATILSPTDYWAFASSATGLFMQDVAKTAYRTGEIGMIGGVNTWMTQNVQSYTRGTAVTATLNSLFSTTYALTLNSNTMSIALQFATSLTVVAGDVFQIGDVFAVNPVTKATANYLQQFVIVAAAGGTAAVTVTISPPIITTGAFQNASAAPTASSVVTFKGTASTNYIQNMAFHKNALALVMVPMVRPPGAVDVSRQSYKGYSVRVIPYYSGDTDLNNWRLDVLYGVKCLDPRMAVRLAGT